MKAQATSLESNNRSSGDPQKDYVEPMEAHDSRIYFERHRPSRIPPRNFRTWFYVLTRALADNFTAVEIHVFMRLHHEHLGYGLPQLRTVHRWVERLKLPYGEPPKNRYEPCSKCGVIDVPGR